MQCVARVGLHAITHRPLQLRRRQHLAAHTRCPQGTRQREPARAGLVRHLDWQRERNLDESGYVFTNTAGQSLRPWAFSTRDLDRTALAAGITKTVSLYALRHTFATLHVAAGTPLKVASDVLGHATIQQTANTSMHGDQAVTQDWMQRFKRALDAAKEAARAPVN